MSRRLQRKHGFFRILFARNLSHSIFFFSYNNTCKPFQVYKVFLQAVFICCSQDDCELHLQDEETEVERVVVTSQAHPGSCRTRTPNHQGLILDLNPIIFRHMKTRPQRETNINKGVFFKMNADRKKSASRCREASYYGFYSLLGS